MYDRDTVEQMLLNAEEDESELDESDERFITRISEGYQDTVEEEEPTNSKATAPLVLFLIAFFTIGAALLFTFNDKEAQKSKSNDWLEGPNTTCNVTHDSNYSDATSSGDSMNHDFLASISSEWTNIDEQTFNDLRSYFNDVKTRKIIAKTSTNHQQSQSCYDLSSWLFSEYSHLSKQEFKTKILKNRQKPIQSDQCLANSAIDHSHRYSFKSRIRINKFDTITAFMVKLMNILEEYGQNCFLFDSSAVEWYRSCEIVNAQDHDFDVGVFRHNLDPNAIQKAIKDVRLTKEFGTLYYEFEDGRIRGDYISTVLQTDFFDIFSVDYTPIISSVSGVGPNNFWYFRPFSLQKVDVIVDNDTMQISAPYPIESYVIDECGATFVNEPWNVDIAPINRQSFEGHRLKSHHWIRDKSDEQMWAFDFEWLRSYCYESEADID